MFFLFPMGSPESNREALTIRLYHILSILAFCLPRGDQQPHQVSDQDQRQRDDPSPGRLVDCRKQAICDN
jgi:hypothetical protein